MRPGTTGKYRNRPLSRLPALTSLSSDIAQGLFAEGLHDGGAQNPGVRGTFALERQLHGEAGDIYAVPSGVALVGGVGCCRKSVT